MSQQDLWNDKIDLAKSKLQKNMYNLFGVAAFFVLIAIQVVNVYDKDVAPLNLAVEIGFSLILTLLLWNNYYSSGKLMAKGLERYITLNSAIDQIGETIYKSGKSATLDKWCTDFRAKELETAREKLILSARLDYAVYLDKYSILDRAEIRELRPPCRLIRKIKKISAKGYELTKRQAQAIIKAQKMRENKDITADTLLNEHGHASLRVELGAGESELQRKSTRTKATKFILFSVITAYWGWKITQTPSVDMLINALISCLPYVSTAIFAWKSGIEDVKDKLMRRNNNRKNLLCQFCADENINIEPLTHARTD